MRKIGARLQQLRTEILGQGPGAVLVRGAGTALWVRVGGIGLLLLAQIFLARVLRVDEYGTYVYTMTWVAIVAMVGSVGLDIASPRFVGEYQGRQEWGRLRAFLRNSRRIALGTSAAIALLGAAVIALLRERLPEGTLPVAFLACAVLPPLVFLNMNSAGLRALRKIARAQIPLEILRPLLLVMGLGAHYLISAGASKAVHAMVATLIAIAAAGWLSSFLLRNVLISEIPLAGPAKSEPEWLRVALPLLLLGGFHLLLAHTDILVVGSLMSARDAGIYSAASRLALLVLLGLTVVNTIAGPMIASYHAQDDRRRLQRTLDVAARAIALLALPTALLLLVAGEWLLSVFGQEFRDAYPPLAILTIGQLANALAGSVGFVMAMTGHHVQATKIVGWTALANLALNLVLIPRFGLLGAASATTAATVVWNIAMLHYVRRRLGLNTTLFRPSDA